MTKHRFQIVYVVWKRQRCSIAGIVLTDSKVTKPSV